MRASERPRHSARGLPQQQRCNGLISGFREYPLQTFLDRGVIVTLNSDDPALFDTSIEKEFLQAAREWSLSKKQLAMLSENAARAAFLPEEEKQSLLLEIQQAAAA